VKDNNFDFEQLLVYQKSLEFIHEVLEIYKKLPVEFKHTIGDNLEASEFQRFFFSR